MTNTELMNLIINAVAKSKRKMSPPPPPPLPRYEKKHETPTAPPPSPPPPPLGSGSILIKIYENNGITTKELAKELNIRMPSVSEAIKKLDLKELIQKEKSCKDKRSKKLYLTGLGMVAAKQYIIDQEKWATEYFKNLSLTERELLGTLLTKMIHANQNNKESY